MGSVWTIRRSATDAKLTGLCGGLARHWGVDPVLVRVGCGLLALSGGVGLVLYVAGWLLVPVDGRQTSVLDDFAGRQTSRWPREAWVAIVIVACLISFAVLGPLMPFGFAPALILAVIWYFGYYKNRSRLRPPGVGNPPAQALPAVPPQPFRYAGPATPFTEAAEAWHDRMAEHLGRPAPAAAPERPVPFAGASAAVPVQQEWPTMPVTSADPRVSDPPTAEDRAYAAFLATPDPVGLYTEERAATATAVVARSRPARSLAARRLRLTAVLVLGLVLAGLALADRQGVAVPLTAYLGAALLVLGLTLVAATWFGRARGILPVGIAVLIALLSATAVTPYGDPRNWSRDIAYTRLADLPAGGDRQKVGRLHVDLRQLRVPRDAIYAAHVELGSLEVLAPDDVAVDVRYAADQGVAVLNGTPVQSGTSISGTSALDRGPTTGPTLTIEVSADVGEVRVTR